MKTEKDFYNDTWDNMTKTHRAQAPEFVMDLWEWWHRWQARKLKAVMDRSKAYWARKKAQKEKDLQHQKVELMWEHRKRYRELFKEIREEAVREAKE